MLIYHKNVSVMILDKKKFFLLYITYFFPGFYTFLFSHPSLIIKNPQWFTDKNNSDTLNENDLLNDVQSSSSLAVLKHQLVVLSKLYRNELQARQSAPVKKRRSTGGSMGKQKKQDVETKSNDIQGKEQQQDELMS